MKLGVAACIAAPLLWLSACATVPVPGPVDPLASEARWRQHQAAVEGLDRFLLNGRVTSAELALRADLRWQQATDGHFELRLAGPFGAGAVELRGDSQSVEVRNSEGSQFTHDPENWIRTRYGWTLPISGLRFWALGVPIPNAPLQKTLDGAGRLETLAQNGWTLTYTEYRLQNGYDLPRRFEADNGQVKLKLLIDQWDELPAINSTP